MANQFLSYLTIFIQLLLIPLRTFFFFCLFPSQSFKVFFYIIVKTLLPFLFLSNYNITCMNHSNFLKNFNSENLRFWMFLGVLIWNGQWVFVNALYIHNSYAWISKFSWFLKILEIRAHVFLGKLGILFNWIKLGKIDLCSWLIEFL